MSEPVEPLRPLTDDEKERVSSHCARLRNDAGFIAAVESAKEQIMKEILDTAPTDVARREALYAEARALLRLDGRLKSMAEQRNTPRGYRSSP